MLEKENDIPFEMVLFHMRHLNLGGCNLSSFEICGTFKKGDASPFKEGDTSLEDPGLLMGSDLSLQRWIVTSKWGWKGHGLESPGFLFSFPTKNPPQPVGKYTIHTWMLFMGCWWESLFRFFSDDTSFYNPQSTSVVHLQSKAKGEIQCIAKRAWCRNFKRWKHRGPP